MSLKTKALTRGAPLIALAIALLFAVGYAVTALIGLPFGLGLASWLRLAGVVLIVAGLSVIGWTFRLRGFSEILVSTYVTFTKFATGTPLEAKAGREEPLVIAGPYMYVRSPLYSGVVVIVLGWGLLTSSTFVLVSTVVIFIWFRLFVIRFEEKELRALFGAQFKQYADEVPAMIPFTKLRRRPKRAGRGSGTLAPHRSLCLENCALCLYSGMRGVTTRSS